jgi:hypothetical protein
MEVQLRQHFCTNKLTNESSSANIVHVLLAQDELYVQWRTTTSTSPDDEHALSIFKIVVELYVTIRGFAFAKSCVELYKQATKKQTAKSKGLRKTTSNTTK